MDPPPAVILSCTLTLGICNMPNTALPSVLETRPLTRRVSQPNLLASGTKVSIASWISMTSRIWVALPVKSAKCFNCLSKWTSGEEEDYIPTSLNWTIVEIGKSQCNRYSNSLARAFAKRPANDLGLDWAKVSGPDRSRDEMDDAESDRVASALCSCLCARAGRRVIVTTLWGQVSLRLMPLATKLVIRYRRTYCSIMPI